MKLTTQMTDPKEEVLEVPRDGTTEKIPAGELAQFYFDQGLSVLPFYRPDGKHDGKEPVVKNPSQYKDYAIDEDLFWSHWGKGLRNLGLVLGKYSGLVVVDTDSEEAEQWAREHLPPTDWMVKTGRGYHRYYLRTGPTRSQPFKGIDVKGDRTFVLLPGSLHKAGVVYGFVGWNKPKENLPAFDPAWFNDLNPIKAAKITRPDRNQRKTNTGNGKQNRNTGKAKPFEVPAWVQEIPPEVRLQQATTYHSWWKGVGEGQRNSEMLKRAGTITNGFACEREDAWKLLVDLNQKNHPPLEEDELQAILDSAWNKRGQYEDYEFGHRLSLSKIRSQRIVPLETQEACIEDIRRHLNSLLAEWKWLQIAKGWRKCRKDKTKTCKRRACPFCGEYCSREWVKENAESFRAAYGDQPVDILHLKTNGHPEDAAGVVKETQKMKELKAKAKQSMVQLLSVCIGFNVVTKDCFQVSFIIRRGKATDQALKVLEKEWKARVPGGTVGVEESKEKADGLAVKLHQEAQCSLLNLCSGELTAEAAANYLLQKDYKYINKGKGWSPA